MRVGQDLGGRVDPTDAEPADPAVLHQQRVQVSVDLHQLDQRRTVVAQRPEEAVHLEVPAPLPRARHLESMLPDGAFELAALP